MNAKRELLFRMRQRYASAGKSEKTEILDGFVSATGYHRKYAVSILRQSACEVNSAAQKVRVSFYDEEVRSVLIGVWKAANQICSKRLAAFLPEFVAALERFGHLEVDPAVRSKLLKLSPSSIDRLLREERKKHPRGVSTTRPSNLLKQRIKVRTFADWNEKAPGFFEADLVAHCGDRAEGNFLSSLVVTDIDSGWTECVPLLEKTDEQVLLGLDAIRAVLPIPMLGLDTDNGSEFINHSLFQYCEHEKITFTRSRAYKKNDQAHIEQKNGAVVRRVVGYDRFESYESYLALYELYNALRAYVNFFQPSTKLLTKTRIGSRTQKVYDKPQTPYQRLMNSKHVPTPEKEHLQKLYESLDPLKLFDRICDLQTSLFAKASILAGEQIIEPVVENTLRMQSTSVQPTLKALRPIRKKHRPCRTKIPHTWRTRKDPMEGCYECAKLLFNMTPSITSTEMFKQLCLKFPEKFTGGELKTVQRRLSAWRREAMRISIVEVTTNSIKPLEKALGELTAKALNLPIETG